MKRIYLATLSLIIGVILIIALTVMGQCSNGHATLAGILLAAILVILWFQTAKD